MSCCQLPQKLSQTISTASELDSETCSDILSSPPKSMGLEALWSGRSLRASSWVALAGFEMSADADQGGGTCRFGPQRPRLRWPPLPETGPPDSAHPPAQDSAQQRQSTVRWGRDQAVAGCSVEGKGQDLFFEEQVLAPLLHHRLARVVLDHRRRAHPQHTLQAHCT
jgi:hypothetical protein